MASEPAAVTPGQNTDNWFGSQSVDAGGTAASSGRFWPPAEGAMPSGDDETQHAFQSTIDDDDGTDTDTASDAGSALADDDLPGETPAAKFERYFWQYDQAKKRFRRFAGKPVRKARRFVKRTKGKGKGGRGAMTFLSQELVLSFL